MVVDPLRGSVAVDPVAPRFAPRRAGIDQGAESLADRDDGKGEGHLLRLSARYAKLRPVVSPAAPVLPKPSARGSDHERPHGSIRIESRMARISATGFRGELGDQFASIIRRVPSMSRIQNSSVRPGSLL